MNNKNNKDLLKSQTNITQMNIKENIKSTKKSSSIIKKIENANRKV